MTSRETAEFFVTQHVEKLSARMRRIPVQRGLQYLFLAFYVYVGLRFYAYVQWAIGNSPKYAAKPPSVEAFLPISALMGAKRLLLTGNYDSVHPAGLTIFLFAVGTALLLRKSFCGCLCPVGAVSMLLGHAGERLGLSRRPGKLASALLSAPKYLLLLFFIWIVIVGMSVRDIEGFSRTSYNMVADTKMLLFFLRPGTTLLVTLGVLVLGSMLFPAFWCRGFCPYGALLGLFSWLSPTAVRRDAATCTGCRRCTKACPSRIPVHEKTRVSGPECVACMACVRACPEAGCLTVRLGYTAKAPQLPAWSLAAGTLGLLLLCFVWAQSTGHWQSTIPPEMIRMQHRNIDRIGHP